MLLEGEIEGKKVALECFDNDASKMHSTNILLGKTYHRVPYVKDVKVILDIGANVGAASTFFSCMYPQAQIYSVEPAKLPFELLKKNCLKNPLNKIYNIGLFNEDRAVPLYHSRVDSVTASIGKSFLNTRENEEIKLRAAATWLQEEKITDIDILKIDTEGCEYQILASMKSWAEKAAVIYLEYHNEEDRRAIDSLLAPTHILYQAKVEKAHCGEFTYVRTDLGYTETDLHSHRIKVNI